MENIECTTQKFIYKNKELECFSSLIISLIGGKWKLTILYYIYANDPIRFSQIKKHINNINERVLIRQLKELESDNLIIRKDYKTSPPKVEYSLAPFGKKALPILEDLEVIGKQYYNDYVKKSNS